LHADAGQSASHFFIAVSAVLLIAGLSMSRRGVASAQR